VSSLGRVRRVRACNNAHAGQLLRISRDSKGYPKVGLCRGGRTRTHQLHRLVGLAFLGSPPFIDSVIAHWDGDPTNNAVTNLRWATRVENEADKRRHGRVHWRPQRTGRKRSRLDAWVVKRMRRRVAAGASITEVALQEGVHRNTARYAVYGLTWSRVTTPPPLPFREEVRHAG